MATVRNIAGDERWIPLVGLNVADRDTFEVDDDLFDSVQFSPVLFEVVEQPRKSKPAKAETKVKE